MTPNISLEKLVREAINLRDHLLHVEGQDSVQLGAALQPFDREKDLSKITDKQVSVLNAAFQKSYDNALKAVDGYTLNEVLKGRSPHIFRPRASGSFVLMAFGVMLVMAAFHFSYWSNRTTFMLGQAEEFRQFDHFQNIMKLVELENYFDTVKEQSPTKDLEPQLVYLEGLSTLRAHYTDEQYLPQNMRDRLIELNPARKFMDDIKRDLCRQVVQSDKTVLTGWQSWLITCPTQMPQPPDAEQPVEASTEATKLAELDLGSLTDAEAVMATPDPGLFQAKLGEIERLQAGAMSAAGRERLSEYASSQYEVATMAQRLRELLNIVHRWALPIIYGALGSIVYCMWRVLNPNIAQLGFIYSVMRTAFAGLAALTLSMLLVPSNVMSAGIELNRPVIYLLSFIFGYSIEAFVSTLNLLNTYLTTNLTPKPKGG